MIRERSALPATAWPTRPVRSILASREEYGGDGPLLSLSAQHGVRYRDLSEGRAASDDLSNYRVVRPGDLVINRLSARDGAYAVSSLTGLVSPAYWVLRPSQNIDPRWVDYVLRSSPYRAEIGRISKFMPPAQFDLPWPLFRNLPIPAPPPSEQRAIADFLDRETAQIDAMIDAQERLVALLEERRMAAISLAVTRGLDDSAELVDSGNPLLGDIPASWSAVQLRRLLAERVTDGPHSTPVFLDDGVPFLSVDGIQDGELVFENCRYISVEDHEEFKHKTLPRRDDILMGKAASTGKIARVKVDFEFSIWSPLAVIRLDRDVAEPAFVEMALKSLSAQRQIDLLCTYNTQKNIAMSDIPSIVVALPPLDEQRHIVAHLAESMGQASAMIFRARESIALMKERRAALISAAVTGRIDVRTGIEQVERELEEARA